MLERLAAEIVDLRAAMELIVAYDDEEVSGEDAGALVDRAFPSRADIVLLPARGVTYYALKNLGADRASGDLLVFVDSDVVPEPGWLGELLRSFERPDVAVVGGTVYVEPVGVWGKAFALTWFFPLRAEKPALEPHAIFFASNVAFRRDVFERFPFPDAPGTARRACVLLAQRLREHGIAVYRHEAAQVSHPAPAESGGPSSARWRRVATAPSSPAIPGEARASCLRASAQTSSAPSSSIGVAWASRPPSFRSRPGRGSWSGASASSE